MDVLATGPRQRENLSVSTMWKLAESQKSTCKKGPTSTFILILAVNLVDVLKSSIFSEQFGYSIEVSAPDSSHGERLYRASDDIRMF
jgi:hypothetical protein